MIELVFLLEEPSAREMLKGLLPRILPQDVSFRLIAFEGKQDLEGQIERKIRGYRVPGAHFVVLRDQDNGDCGRIKQKLKTLCTRAGHNAALVRIACQELESWYLADLAAVELGLELPGLARRQARYRNPDAVSSPARELERISGGAYQKIGGSRAIGRFLDPENTRSTSFRHLVEGILKIAGS